MPIDQVAMSVMYHLQDRTQLEIVNCNNVAYPFLGADAKLRFVMSARPSVRMERTDSTGGIFLPFIQGVSKRFEHLLLWPPRSPDLTPCDFFLWG